MKLKGQEGKERKEVDEFACAFYTVVRAPQEISFLV